jgi:hypothetical protein
MSTLTARQLCLKIKEYKQLIKANLKTIVASSNSQDEVIDKILDLLQLSIDDKKNFKNTLVVEQGVVCSNSTEVSQLNVFDSSECAKVLGCIRRSNYNNNRTNFYNQMLTMGYSDQQALKQLAYLDTMCTFEGTQINDANIKQVCLINNAANSINLSTYNPLAIAMYESLIEQDKATSELDCNMLPTNYSSDEYVKVLDSCINHVGLKQKNIAICVSNFNQSNIADIYQQCKINVAPKPEPEPEPEPEPKPEPEPEPKPEPVPEPQPDPKPDTPQGQDYTLYYGIGAVVLLLLLVLLIGK